MAQIKIATLHNPAEFIISMIKGNCNNIDDLSKIAVSVECLIADCIAEKEPPTLKQLLTQQEQKIP